MELPIFGLSLNLEGATEKVLQFVIILESIELK